MSQPKPYDGPLRWLVPSSSKPGEHHLVQLDAYGVNGCCTCPDFTCRHEPILKADPRLGGVDKTRCKHIRKVRQAFIDRLIDELRSKAAALLMLACASLGAAPSDAFLDALAWSETRNRNITGDAGDALGPYQWQLSAWIDADHHRKLAGLPRQDWETGARCPRMARAYAVTLLTVYEVRLRDRGLTPTASRLWLCWTMGFNGAKQVGFNVNAAPAVKRRGYQRLASRLGEHLPTTQR